MAIVVKRKEYVRITDVNQTQFYETCLRSTITCIHDSVRVTMEDGTQFLGKIQNYTSNGEIGVKLSNGSVHEKISLITNTVEVICNGD